MPAPDPHWYKTVFKLPGDRTLIDCWRPRRNRDNDYLIDREMQRTQNFTGIASGREQDMAMTDGMGCIAERWREHLGTTDIAIIAAAAAHQPGARSPERHRAVRAAPSGALPHPADRRRYRYR